jgi:hypothetical protein
MWIPEAAAKHPDKPLPRPMSCEEIRARLKALAKRLALININTSNTDNMLFCSAFIKNVLDKRRRIDFYKTYDKTK